MLRRDIAGPAHHHSGAGELGGVEGLGDPEVDHLRAIGAEQHVAGLEVAVEYAHGVHVGERVGQTGAHLAHHRLGHRPAADHRLGERGAGDVLGRQPGQLGRPRHHRRGPRCAGCARRPPRRSRAGSGSGSRRRGRVRPVRSSARPARRAGLPNRRAGPDTPRPCRPRRAVRAVGRGRSAGRGRAEAARSLCGPLKRFVVHPGSGTETAVPSSYTTWTTPPTGSICGSSSSCARSTPPGAES